MANRRKEGFLAEYGGWIGGAVAGLGALFFSGGGLGGILIAAAVGLLGGWVGNALGKEGNFMDNVLGRETKRVNTPREKEPGEAGYVPPAPSKEQAITIPKEDTKAVFLVENGKLIRHISNEEIAQTSGPKRTKGYITGKEGSFLVSGDIDAVNQTFKPEKIVTLNQQGTFIPSVAENVKTLERSTAIPLAEIETSWTVQRETPAASAAIKSLADQFDTHQNSRLSQRPKVAYGARKTNLDSNVDTVECTVRDGSNSYYQVLCEARGKKVAGTVEVSAEPPSFLEAMLVPTPILALNSMSKKVPVVKDATDFVAVKIQKRDVNGQPLGELIPITEVDLTGKGPAGFLKVIADNKSALDSESVRYAAAKEAKAEKMKQLAADAAKPKEVAANGEKPFKLEDVFTDVPVAGAPGATPGGENKAKGTAPQRAPS